MGNCVSGSKDVKEDDPPIEKAEVNNVQSIPTIEINGPSNSPSKENGLANNHPATPPHSPEKAQSEPDESPQKQQSTPKSQPEEEKEPLFPHVSPFKPQFDYRKDVTLSSRASKIFDDNTFLQNGVAGDLSLDASSNMNREHGDELENSSAPISPLEESGKDIDGVSPLSPAEDEDDKDSFTREVTRAIEEGEGKVSATTEGEEEDRQPQTEDNNQSAEETSPTTAPTDPEQVQVEVVKDTSEVENKSEDDNSQAAPADEEGVTSTDKPTIETTTTTTEEDSEKPGKTTIATPTTTTNEDNSSSTTQPQDASGEKPEDRSAILAHFLSHQSGPEVAGSDDDESAGFQFAVKPDKDEDFLANQVDDDAIDQSQKPPHPLVTEDSNGGKGDSGGQEILSALQKCAVVSSSDNSAGVNGEEEVTGKFEESDRQKLNELLNEIEQIAEQQGRFD